MSYHSRLTQREREILSLLAAGKRNGEMALALHITVHTIETHLRNIYSKLALRTRTEAARWFWDHCPQCLTPIDRQH